MENTSKCVVNPSMAIRAARQIRCTSFRNVFLGALDARACKLVITRKIFARASAVTQWE